MGDLVDLALSPQAAATEVNTSQTEDVSIGVPSQVQLVLEVLIVLMCVAAVAGTQQQILFFFLVFELF